TPQRLAPTASRANGNIQIMYSPENTLLPRIRVITTNPITNGSVLRDCFDCSAQSKAPRLLTAKPNEKNWERVRQLAAITLCDPKSKPWVTVVIPNICPIASKLPWRLSTSGGRSL